MKVLCIRRQMQGGLADYSNSLVEPLKALGIFLTFWDAHDEIPNETGFWPDRKVSKILRAKAEQFDLVHAWGYRAAWASAEALKLNRPWIYTAWDMPKTRHTHLIDRLNHARVGICTSYVCRAALEEVHTLNLQVVLPGVEVPRDLPEMEEARKSLGLPLGVPLVVAMGRFVPERGFIDLLEAFPKVWESLPDCLLVIAGEGPQEREIKSLANRPQIEILPWQVPWPLLRAADLVVVPSVRQSTSMVALKAMAASRPVLVRRVGGMPDIALEHVAIRAFDSNEDLPNEIVTLLSDESLLQSLGYSALVRVEDRFLLEEAAAATSRVYHEAT
ncbi:MAG: glycosyltransferase family 4 protein [Fimbriimonadaceae bacterium]|jgi:glycosyltransferase involved in cell wall biosynthesis|nr:glycosyltransferase family 4 protein [Fimbriimonadaceae bacterium]